jgi:uncharacterized OB-fold protein
MHVPLVEPPALDVAQPFWDAIEQRQLRLPRCSACGRFQWYPDDTGPDCDGAIYEWMSVPTTGVLHTFTRVHRAFLPGVENALPFTVGFVELDGVEGARLVALLREPPALTIGDRVEATFVDVDGRIRPVFGKATDRTHDGIESNGDTVAEEGLP